MKIRYYTLLFFIVFAVIIDINAQTNSPKSIIEIQNDPSINKQTRALTQLIDDIRRAVYESENELKECLPPFAKTSITLEGTNERETGVEFNLIFFKINSKKKKGRTNKTIITFEKDSVLAELNLTPSDGTDTNFKILKRQIVSAAYSNCLFNIPNLDGEGILDKDDDPNIITEESEPVLTERFRTSKLEIQFSFFVDKELGASGEFKIIPISGSLGRSIKRKNIQTVRVFFGKDP